MDIRIGERIIFVALGNSRERIRFPGIRPLLIPPPCPGHVRMWSSLVVIAEPEGGNRYAIPPGLLIERYRAGTIDLLGVIDEQVGQIDPRGPVGTGQGDLELPAGAVA